MMDNILQQEDFQHATSFSCFLFKKKLFSQEKNILIFAHKQTGILKHVISIYVNPTIYSVSTVPEMI